jgi:hypothetical protein
MKLGLGVWILNLYELVRKSSRMRMKGTILVKRMRGSMMTSRLQFKEFPVSQEE